MEEVTNVSLMLRISERLTSLRMNCLLNLYMPQEMHPKLYYISLRHPCAATKRGLFTLVPLCTSEGYRVMVLYGINVPLFLGPGLPERTAESLFEFLGAAQDHGFADGQAA